MARAGVARTAVATDLLGQECVLREEYLQHRRESDITRAGGHVLRIRGVWLNGDRELTLAAEDTETGHLITLYPQMITLKEAEG